LGANDIVSCHTGEQFIILQASINPLNSNGVIKWMMNHYVHKGHVRSAFSLLRFLRFSLVAPFLMTSTLALADAQDTVNVANRYLDLFAAAFRDGGDGRVLFVICHEFLRFRSHCTGKNTTDCGSDKNRKHGRKRR
jgi:hypothetical protein